MFKEILSIFQSNPVHRLALITSIATNVVKTFEQEFAADHNSKDAAIDALVALLQYQKGAPASAPAAPEAPKSA